MSTGRRSVPPPRPPDLQAPLRPVHPAAPAAPGQQPYRPAPPRRPARRPEPTTVKYTLGIDKELLERLKDAFDALQARGVYRTLGGGPGSLIHDLLTRGLTGLADEHNDGEPFPPRRWPQLPTGRPMS